MTPDAATQMHKGVLWVFVSGTCNFRCEYCVDDRYFIPSTDWDTQLFLDRLDELQRALGFMIVLTGGEPMAASDVVDAIFDRFAHVPKTVQTNGSLTRPIVALAPKIGKRDWISISYHDFAWRKQKHEDAIRKTVDELLSRDKNVFVQFMCTPENTARMAEKAASFRDVGCRIALRRIFSYEPELFKDVKQCITDAGGEDWSTPAFFRAAQVNPIRQPFLAATVHLDGTISFVCEDEVKIGNLYTGYDLSIVDQHRQRICEEICPCCSCLWVNKPWGFA